MSRVTSQYPALNGGVSQRPERLLRPNQLRTQLNMVYDPVLGLTRRPGTKLAASRPAAGSWDGESHAVFKTLIDGTPLSVHYKTKASAAAGDIFVVDDTSGGLQIATAKAGDGVADSLRTSGVNAVAAIGDLIILAPAAYTPTYSTTYPWAVASNQRHHVVWVRGGAYSRVFTLTLVRGNQKCKIEYTTLDASYPKVLDTSDLLPTDPDYSKKVNDRTNAYNSEATAWIAAAINDIAPENIARKLSEGLTQSGFLSDGATVTVIGSTIFIADSSVEEVEADDAGDGNLIRAAGNTVGAPELLTTQALPGKIVKVRPGNSERGEVFYLKARAKDASTGYTAVTWEEAAGEITTPTRLFVYMARKSNGTYVYSSDLAWINTETGRAFVLPKPSVSGDLLSNPAPEFFNQPVTALAVFQDRLLVCRKDGYVAMSQIGDYFNFFRQSAVTVVDTDPVAFYITGAVGDTIKNTLTYNSSLLLIGDQRQYALPASQPITPSRNGAAPFTSVVGMNLTPPRLVGDSVFFARFNNGFGSAHSLRPGRVVESPYEVEITDQVNTLIDSRPIDIAVSTTPNVVFLRTRERLFVMDYEHTEGGERYSLHEWTFPEAGTLVSMSAHNGTLFLVFARSAGLYVEKLLLQTTSIYTTGDACSDLWNIETLTGRDYPSIATLVSPRLSPEAGNITGTGLGSQGFSQQGLTVATMVPFFVATSGAAITVDDEATQASRTTNYYPRTE